MLGRLVNEAIAEHGLAYPWGDMLPTLHTADLVCINLECALTRVTDRWSADPEKPFFFRADPEAVATLLIGRVSFASVANNHIMDFGTPGLLETISVLDEAGIACAGAGSDAAAARAPAMISARGWRVAVLAFADYPDAWCAMPGSPGMCFTPVSLDPDVFGFVERAIFEARRQADLVVFSIHWGPNMRLHPPPEFREFAHRVIAAGADIFWGHSAHLLQGIELVGGRPVFYDTGDFIDDYAVDPRLRNDLSALFLVHVSPPARVQAAFEKPLGAAVGAQAARIDRIEIVPARIDHMQVNRAVGETRQLIVRRLTRLCSAFGTVLDDGADGLTVVL